MWLDKIRWDKIRNNIGLVKIDSEDFRWDQMGLNQIKSYQIGLERTENQMGFISDDRWITQNKMRPDEITWNDYIQSHYNSLTSTSFGHTISAFVVIT